MNEEVMYDRACVMQNVDFICIDTYSGYYGSSRDPRGRQYLLAVDAPAEEVGAALLGALSCSRVALPEEAPDLYPDREAMGKEYVSWINGLMRQYGYKNKGALFKTMKSCTVHRRRSEMTTIFPTRHDRLEGWSPLSEADNVVVRSSSTNEELGAAVYAALSRCLGT